MNEPTHPTTDDIRRAAHDHLVTALEMIGTALGLAPLFYPTAEQDADRLAVTASILSALSDAAADAAREDESDAEPVATVRREPEAPSVSASLAGVLEAYYGHAERLTFHKIGISRMTDPAARDHAVSALLATTFVARNLDHQRWSIIRDAFTYGAVLDEVALALQMTRDDVATGYVGWAAGQLELGIESAGRVGFSDDDHAHAVALLWAASQRRDV